MLENVTVQDGSFNFGEDAQIKCGVVEGFSVIDMFFDVRIIGKIKTIPVYIVKVMGGDFRYIQDLKKKYGYPIRQTKLEWGKFTGTANEFVVPRFELIRK